MPSKRSFFNWTLFRKDLGRFWPLWGGVSLAGSLVPLYLLLELTQRSAIRDLSDEFVRILYTAVTNFAPAFLLGYAVLCAMAVWGYLCAPRSVGMMHALPVDRRCLYLTGTAAGLAMLLIPFAVVGGLICLVMTCFGGFAPLAVLETVAAVLLMSLLFFGLATVCAMATGNLFAIPVFYALINFLAPMLDALVGDLASQFLLGVKSDGFGLHILSPVMAIYENFFCDQSYDVWTDAWGPLYLEGMAVVAVFGLLGVALQALGYLMYRRRHSESAGDVVAFSFLRPVFRYGLALLSALSLGRVLYFVLWESVFQKGLYADVVPMAVSLALAGIVGYYAASMLLEKSRRVFRGSWPGVLTVCAGAVILCCLVSVDLLGVESRVPEKSEVVSVSVYGGDTTTLLDLRSTLEVTADDEALLDLVLDLHRAVVASRDYIKATDDSWSTGATPDGREVRWDYLSLHYTLADGTVLRRNYNLPILEEDLRADTGYAAALSRLINSDIRAEKSVSLPARGQLLSMDIYYSYEGLPVTGDLYYEGEEARQIQEALLTDARAGNMTRARTSFDDVNLTYLLEIYMNYTVRQAASASILGGSREASVSYVGGSREDSVSYEGVPVLVYPTMTHTLETLVELGVFTWEDLAAYQEAAG